MELGGLVDSSNLYSHERTSGFVRRKHIAMGNDLPRIKRGMARTSVIVLSSVRVGVKGGANGRASSTQVGVRRLRLTKRRGGTGGAGPLSATASRGGTTSPTANSGNLHPNGCMGCGGCTTTHRTTHGKRDPEGRAGTSNVSGRVLGRTLHPGFNGSLKQSTITRHLTSSPGSTTLHGADGGGPLGGTGHTTTHGGPGKRWSGKGGTCHFDSEQPAFQGGQVYTGAYFIASDWSNLPNSVAYLKQKIPQTYASPSNQPKAKVSRCQEERVPRPPQSRQPYNHCQLYRPLKCGLFLQR